MNGVNALRKYGISWENLFLYPKMLESGTGLEVKWK